MNGYHCSNCAPAGGWQFCTVCGRPNPGGWCLGCRTRFHQVTDCPTVVFPAAHRAATYVEAEHTMAASSVHQLAASTITPPITDAGTAATRTERNP